eukprot:jgi/Tetstr1/441494/TSEL_029725.t1
MRVRWVDADGVVAGSERPYHDVRVYSVLARAPDGSALAFGSDDAMVELRRVREDVPQKLRGHTSRGVYSEAWAPDDRSLASGSSGARVLHHAGIRHTSLRLSYAIVREAMKLMYIVDVFR